MARQDHAILATVVLVTFTVYVAGACPTIYVGDSGELVTAVHLLGIPHPSGYPLYVLLGKLWTLVVPLGSIAYRMSLFSAACAAGACGLLYRACRDVPLSRPAAILAAFTLAFSDSFWAEANVQRVYALNALFVALVVWLTLRWHHRRDRRTAMLVFFCAGVGATNHTVMGVCAVAMLAFMVGVEPRRLGQVRWLGAIGVAFMGGLLPYLYLPWRSRANPALDWGNPETAGTFLNVVLRGDFWDRRWYTGPLDGLTAGAHYLAAFGHELTWLGAVLALLGLLAGFRTAFAARRPAPSDHAVVALIASLVMAANFVAVVLHGSRTDIFVWHRYFVPSYVMAALLVATGWQVVAERMPRRLAIAAAFSIPVFLLVDGFRAHDRSRYHVADAFSRELLRGLPPGAHLIASDDNILFVLLYLRFVEGLRPDVDLVLEGVGTANLPPLRFNADDDPLFLTHYPPWRVDGLEVVPAGLVFRTVRTGHPPPSTVNVPAHLDGELDARVPKDYLTQSLIGQFHYMRGLTLERANWVDARRAYTRAALVAPDNDVLFYNLGLIFAQNGLFDDALEAFGRADAINPRPIVGFKGPLASEQVRRLELEQERLRRIEAALVASASLAALAPGSSAYHAQLSALLDARGEATAARGHRLRSLELATAGPRADPGIR